MSKEPPFWWHVFSLSGFSVLPFFLPLVGVTKRRPQFFYSSVLAYQACHYTMLSHFIRPVLIVFYEIFISPNSFLRLFVRVQHSYWFVCLECWSSASLRTLALFEMTAHPQVVDFPFQQQVYVIFFQESVFTSRCYLAYEFKDEMPPVLFFLLFYILFF